MPFVLLLSAFLTIAVTACDRKSSDGETSAKAKEFSETADQFAKSAPSVVEAQNALNIGNNDLHDAVGSGDLSKVKAAIEKGLDKNAPNGAGNTALHFATQIPSREILDYLLSLRPTVDATNKLGQTPLMWAATTKNSKAIRALLKAGANRDLRSSAGSTALDFARKSEDKESIEALSAASR